MTSRLPTDLLRLFTPRPPLKHVEPIDCPPDDKPRPKLSGISQYVSELASGPKGEPFETQKQQKERLKQERRIQARDNIVRGLSTWDPNLNLQATEDPYKTIIVARLNYDTTEKHLRDEFEGFGGIVSIKMAKDMDGNFCGYAFIEFEHESDMREAYRNADGIRVLGRRIVVDVERGRTVKGWLPRRFGGGLGGTRIGDKSQNQREPGRFDPSVPVVPGRRYDDRGKSHRSDMARSNDRSRSRGYQPYRASGSSGSGGRRDQRPRSRARDHERSRDRDRHDYRHRSRSPSHRSSRRDRSYDRNGGSSWRR
ncbi:hypothetical protein IW140_005439 [Coemansia sp. RSA 1813]|nr:hypothetical protein LPJ74_004535 [Coemansia sp. RSA 1843]KAJ2086919.1 hypothetical protein IW138_005334 [Coemansia sp. RSA 986]KAJ2565181.1 hypothetical protein IW140_005439 [Coemansia sp. RSA 1813]